MYRENVKNYKVKSVPTIPPLPYFWEKQTEEEK
jgi:hypothetical protein